MEWRSGFLYIGLLSVSSLDVDSILHPYWRQFDIESMIPDSWHYGVALWMTFFGILGVLGNLLVIVTFMR